MYSFIDTGAPKLDARAIGSYVANTISKEVGVLALILIAFIVGRGNGDVMLSTSVVEDVLSLVTDKVVCCISVVMVGFTATDAVNEGVHILHPKLSI